MHRSTIPHLDFYKHPVNVNLRIYNNGQTYLMEIKAEGGWVRVPINLKPHDVARLANRLQKFIQTISVLKDPTSTVSSGEIQQNVKDLIKSGHFAYKRIFADQQAQDAINKLSQLGTQWSFEVATDDFFFPWELLYPVPLDQPLNPAHFWGFNHIISRIITQNYRFRPFSPLIPYRNQPTIGLLAYDTLPSVRDDEIPYFEQLRDDNRINLTQLSNLHADNRAQAFGTIKQFMQQPFNVAHFACHATYEADDPDLSRIYLSKEFDISIQEFVAHDIAIAGHPLVIMNACETSALNPLYTSSFANLFLRLGAMGVVVTECQVPDKFASAFGIKLYEQLLAGNPLGESLLTVRQQFYQEQNDPSGLLYAMYASPNIKLLNTGVSHDDNTE